MTARIIVPLEITDANLIEAGTTVPEADAAAWDVATTYDAEDPVMYEHVLYTSAVGSNLGNQPDTDDGSNWIAGLATNRWKVFDGYLQDSATQADSMAWQIETTEFINGVALFGLSAATVRVQLDNDTFGSVYDETFDLVDENHITDYDLWFFAPQIKYSDFAITSLPPYPGKVTVTLTDTGNTCSLSQLAFGKAVELGITVNGFEQDIEIFSDKTPDTFGRVSAVKRGSSDLLEPVIKIETSRIPYLRRTLKEREALPTVFAFDGPTRDNEYIAFGDFERLRTNSVFGRYSELQISIREFV